MRVSPTSLVVVALLAPSADAQQVQWTASDAAASDFYGSTVALDAGLAIVGSTFASGNEIDSGKAYVLDADPASPTFGQELLTLAATDGATFDSFGEALAFSDGLALVGAPEDDDGANRAGSAYLFDVDPSSPAFGQQLAKLVAPVPMISARFGRHCDLKDGIAGIVSAKEAFLFDADPASPTFGQLLTQLVPTGFATAFGASCALGGGLAAVGDSIDDPDMPVGAVYVFDADPGSPTFGQQLARLTPAVPMGDDFFGNDVSIDGDRLLVGAKNSAYALGAVHLFDLTPGPSFGASLDVWFQPDPWRQEQFGWSVELDGERALIGAPFQIDDQSVDTGAVYVFDADDTSPTFGQALSKHTPPGGSTGDNLGWSIALDGDLALAGAPAADDVGSNAGAAWLFGLGDAPAVYCTAKTSSAGCVATISTSQPFFQPTSGAGDYSLVATGVQEGKNGLAFASVSGATALPFNGGVLCVNPPTKRGPVLTSGGDHPFECDGAFVTLVNDGQIVPTGLDAGSGQSAWYQYWYRDPQNGAGQLGTALSNAVQLDFD